MLTVYARPLDPARPLVCCDEASKELRADVRPPEPARPRRPARHDSEYARRGVANCFLFFAPLLGWREVKVTARRARVDWAAAVRDLVDVRFPAAERIVLVLDNLNTHDPASLYAAFPPAEARRIWEKLEVHYTPKHGSWLNMAELELSALGRQCLQRRIPAQAALAAEVAAWTAARNAAGTTVDWRFTTDDARTRLEHLYPVLEPIE